jgi:predicted AlkP superfamily pyrophosphatase or phosphodiesterase
MQHLRGGEQRNTRKKGNTRKLSGHFACFLSFACFVVLLPFLDPPLRAQSEKPKSEQKKEIKLPRISETIVLISISGLPAEALAKPDALGLRTPTLRSLRARGAFSPNVEGVFPSLTAPAHASILTGSFPAEHGVTADLPFDAQTGRQSATPFHSTKEFKGETIWEYVRREGLSAAAVDFPLSTAAAVAFNFHEAAPDETVEEKRLREELLKSIGPAPALAPKAKPLALAQARDAQTAAAASKLIETRRPNLLMLRFSSFEAAELLHGQSSLESKATLEQIDGLIARIIAAIELAGLFEGSTFILLSDHCGMKAEREFRPNAVLAKKKWLSFSDKKGGKNEPPEPDDTWQAVAQTYGGSAAIYVRDPKDESFIKEVEALFIDLHKKPDSPIWRVITQQNAAKLGADPRAVLFLDAAPFCTMSAHISGGSTGAPEERTAFGFSPARSEMRTAILLAGRGIKTNPKFEFARLVDVAPTIARLFGLEMKTARGRVLTEVLTP